MLVGMPGIPKNIDWTSIWYKELRVNGAYAYGVENYDGNRVRTFDLAIEHLRRLGTQLRPLIGERFSLKDFQCAIGEALYTGRSGTVKTLFDLQK